jgi:hypothetical protein
MRISKPEARWFEAPGDPDGARIKVKHLTPGERQDIYDKTMTQEINYKPDEKGNLQPMLRQVANKKEDREKTLTMRVVGWENVMDAEGKPLECTPDNVVRAAREIDGFVELVNGFAVQLEADIKTEREAQEKNLSSTPTES